MEFWRDAIFAFEDGEHHLALASLQRIPEESIFVSANIGLVLITMQEYSRVVDLTEKEIDAATPFVKDPKSEQYQMVLFCRWLRSIALAESNTSLKAACEEFQQLAAILEQSTPANAISFSSPLGLNFSLYTFELRFNAAVCLWRMGMIEESAQELADARMNAKTNHHVEVFEHVMVAGFDPPGLFVPSKDTGLFVPQADLYQRSLTWRTSSSPKPQPNAVQTYFQPNRDSFIPPVPSIPKAFLNAIKNVTKPQPSPRPSMLSELNSINDSSPRSSWNYNSLTHEPDMTSALMSLANVALSADVVSPNGPQNTFSDNLPENDVSRSSIDTTITATLEVYDPHAMPSSAPLPTLTSPQMIALTSSVQDISSPSEITTPISAPIVSMQQPTYSSTKKFKSLERNGYTKKTNQPVEFDKANSVAAPSQQTLDAIVRKIRHDNPLAIRARTSSLSTTTSPPPPIKTTQHVRSPLGDNSPLPKIASPPTSPVAPPKPDTTRSLGKQIDLKELRVRYPTLVPGTKKVEPVAEDHQARRLYASYLAALDEVAVESDQDATETLSLYRTDDGKEDDVDDVEQMIESGYSDVRIVSIHSNKRHTTYDPSIISAFAHSSAESLDISSDGNRDSVKFDDNFSLSWYDKDVANLPSSVDVAATKLYASQLEGVSPPMQPIFSPNQTYPFVPMPFSPQSTFQQPSAQIPPFSPITPVTASPVPLIQGQITPNPLEPPRPQPVAVPDMESYLLVRVGAQGVWRQRWCVLRAATFYILKSPVNVTPFAVVPLGSGGWEVQNASKEEEPRSEGFFDIVRALDNVMLGGSNIAAAEKKAPPFMFELSPKKKMNVPALQVGSSDQLLVLSWVSFLAKAVKGEKTAPSFLIPLTKR